MFLGIYKTWKDARSYCKELSGELLNVHSKGQNDEIQQYSESLSWRNWIGLNDRDVEGNFTWSDGAAYHYKYWSENEPNNTFGSEDCVEIFAHVSGRWNDQDCSKSLNAVCKIQGTYSISNTYNMLLCEILCIEYILGKANAEDKLGAVLMTAVRNMRN